MEQHAVPIKKTVVATGRRKGFWNLLTFSRKGTANKPVGTETIKRTPNNLFGYRTEYLKHRKEVPLR
jgi:hypothetical protein